MPARRRLLKTVAWIVAALFGLVMVVGISGMLLPRRHHAAVRIVLHELAERVFELITDLSKAPEWRSDLKQIEIIARDSLPLRWKETTGFGTIIFAREEFHPPRRFVTRIDDRDQPFSGRWIYELEPTSSGTVLTITEEGEVSNAFFRFMSRFVFGHYRTLESYTRDLARHFGESSRPLRVKGTASKLQ